MNHIFREYNGIPSHEWVLLNDSFVERLVLDSFLRGRRDFYNNQDGHAFATSVPVTTRDQRILFDDRTVEDAMVSVYLAGQTYKQNRKI